jgi:hypothetical protein
MIGKIKVHPDAVRRPSRTTIRLVPDVNCICAGKGADWNGLDSLRASMAGLGHHCACEVLLHEGPTTITELGRTGW